MLVLGINSYSHDSGACLIRDNGSGLEIISIAEARLNRVKRSLDFPFHSIEYCLEHFGVKSIDEVDLVVGVRHKTRHASDDEMLKNVWLERAKKGEKRKDANFKDIYVYNNAFYSALKNISWCHHMDAHAASAHYVSGFDKTAVLTADAGGVGIYLGNNLQLDAIDRVGYSDSTIENGKETDLQVSQDHLGTLFMNATRSLGFSTEGTTMALACFAKDGSDYGRSLLDTSFLQKIMGNGELKLSPPERKNELCSLYTKAIKDIYGYAKRNAASLKHFRDTKYDYSQRYNRKALRPAVDIAYKTQLELEREMLRLAALAKKKTGANKLCIAGGIGLSCVLNRLIFDSGMFEDIFIQPAASDEGLAFGAALWGYYKVKNGDKRHHMTRSYFGKTYTQNEVDAAAQKAKMGKPKRVTAAQVAALIADGKIIGRFSDRSEFGPRALGNRSILADPRSEQVSKKINESIKQREWFRPFAPACTFESRDIYFDMPVAGPFMIMAAPLRKEYYENLAAIRHVDNSVRPQTVTHEQNAGYYNLMKAFGALTGYEVLLNTSFNSKKEPIVESPLDAFLSAIEIGLDYVYVEDDLYDVSESKLSAGDVENIRAELEKEKNEQYIINSKNICKPDLISKYEKLVHA